jgi:oxygen-independent coproporphyrinogen-3 oxidase
MKENATLGLYLHVPFCKHACPYCDFYKLELRDRPARDRIEFPELLARECELLLDAHPELRARTIETIYFGGGTPSTLVPAGVGAAIERMLGNFVGAVPDIEITLEANPENLTEGRAAKWFAAGVTRLSMGAQSFAPRHLEKLERLHGPDTIRDAVANSRACGFANINIDLMFALPDQSFDEWMESLAAAVALAPEHISFYGLTVHEHTPFEIEERAGRLAMPDDDMQATMYLRGAEFLERAGYEHYEISNFARPGFRSRHNRRYWSRADVLAMGPSAHSSVGAERWRNPSDIDAWGAAIRDGRVPAEGLESLTTNAILEEALFCNLRRVEGIAAAEQPELFARATVWAATLDNESRSMWTLSPEGSFRLTRAGWLVSDAIIQAIISSPPVRG